VLEIKISSLIIVQKAQTLKFCDSEWKHVRICTLWCI